MKKFLFTLAALLMAGSVCAEEYLYIEDFEATPGAQQTVVVKAHFEAMVSAFECFVEVPEGVTIVRRLASTEANITYLAPFEIEDEETGDITVVYQETTLTPGITDAADPGHYVGITSATAVEWDYIDGEITNCGAVKWKPGEFGMFRLRLEFAEDFKGGVIKVRTQPACGNDPRGNTCEKNQDNLNECNVTVPGGSEPEVTATPVITYDEDTFTVTATGAGTVKLYVNGEEVENPYTFELGEEETTYTVTATAQEEGKEISETAELEVTVPAAPVVVDKTPKPIIDVFDDPEAQTVTVRATGYGHICIYWDDMLQAEGEGVAEWVIPYGDEAEEYGISATAQEEGYEVSDYALATVEVPQKSTTPEPYETPAPEVTYVINDDAVVITATGEGTVTLYVQYIDMVTGEMTTETYEGNGTATVTIPRGEEDAFINYWAVAQADPNAEPGSTDVEYYFEIPALEVGPVDPNDHSQGVWIVTFDKDDNELWIEMLKSNQDYTCIVRYSYGVYGTFPYDPNLSMAENDANRPNEFFYIVIDGVRYGAEADGTLTVLGTALSNPLYENENLYMIPNALGRVYNMGVAIDEIDPSKKYVYAAVAAYTELDEMNAAKTVAGVRYYNMAGQEMQEANGMTIVVTTYTDGTTSAVKVMK